MNLVNDSSKNESKTTATDIKNVSVFTKGQVIAVKLNQVKRSPAAKLSSRPSRSLIKTKSLTKPFKGRS